MTESMGRYASTVHKLLGYKPQNGGFDFEHRKYNRLPYDVVIVDEFPMMDLPLTYHLLEAMSNKASLVIVGDIHQLPSVGAGNVLSDFIASEKIPVTFLTDIFRQRKGSSILQRSVSVMNGRLPSLVQSKDFSFYRNDDNKTLQIDFLIEYKKAIEEYGIDEVAALSPMRKGGLGVIELNRFLQGVVNPESHLKGQLRFGSTTFREGDKAIQTRTNEVRNCERSDWVCRERSAQG